MIRHLRPARGSEVAMKADATYVNECLLTKANKSEALTTVATQSLERRVEGLQDAVRDHQVLLQVLERSRSDADSKGAEQSTATQQLVSRLQQEIEGLRSGLDRTVDRDELDSALEGKANKSSVATALHRKVRTNRGHAGTRTHTAGCGLGRDAACAAEQGQAGGRAQAAARPAPGGTGGDVGVAALTSRV